MHAESAYDCTYNPLDEVVYFTACETFLQYHSKEKARKSQLFRVSLSASFHH